MSGLRYVMIYRVDGEHGEVNQALDWKVYTRDGQWVPLSSEEALREHLKRHPDEDFFLIPGSFMNREIQGTTAARFDPRGEHIRCGLVRYDQASGKIVTRDGINVTYSARAKQWGEGLALLQQATKRLGEVLGPAAQWVLVTWDRTQDSAGNILFTLKLSDWETSVTADFTPEELQSPYIMRLRLYRLWGDALQHHSDIQHRKVEQLVSGQVQAGD
jgi:hypothetical protein